MKEEIIDRILNAITTQGLTKFSIDDFAEAGGVSRGTLYKYAKSKDDILELLIERMAGRIDEHFNHYLSAPADSDLTRIKQLFRALPRIIGPKGQTFMLEVKKSRPDLVARMFAERRRQFKRVEEKLLEAQRAGALRSDISIRVAMAGLLAMAEHLITPEFVMESGEGFETVLDTIFEIFFHGIVAIKDAKTNL